MRISNFKTKALYYTTLPIFGAFYSYNFTKVEINNLTSYVSEVSEIQFILVSLFLFFLLISFLLHKKFHSNYLYSILIVFEILYLFAGGIASGFILKSYQNQAIPPGSFYGDMSALLLMSDKFATQLDFTLDYPVGVPIILSFLAFIFSSNVVDVSVLGWFLISLYQPLLILKLWQKVIGYYPAIILVTTLYFLEFHNYKSVAISALLPFILIIFNEVSKEGSINLNFRLKIRLLLFGIIFSFTQILYWAYLYWLIPFLIGTLLFLYFQNNPIKLTRNLLNYLIGTTIIPFCLLLLKVESLEIKLVIAAIYVASLTIWLFDKIPNWFYRIYPLFIVATLMLILFMRQPRDAYFYEESSQFVAISFLNSFWNVLFLVFMLIAWTFLSKNQRIYNYIFIISSIATSSLIMGIYYSAKMYSTGFVNLWPRAIHNTNHNLNFLFLLLFSLLTFKLILFIQSKQKQMGSLFVVVPTVIFLWLFIYQSINNGSNYLKTSLLPLDLTKEACSPKLDDSLTQDWYLNNENLSGYVIEKCGKLSSSYIFPNLTLGNIIPVSPEDFMQTEFRVYGSIETPTRLMISLQNNLNLRSLELNTLCRSGSQNSISFLQRNNLIDKVVFEEDLNYSKFSKMEKYHPILIELSFDKSGCNFENLSQKLLGNLQLNY
jgi:hypothetical protein